MGEKGHTFGIVAKLALEMALSDSKLCSYTFTLNRYIVDKRSCWVLSDGSERVTGECLVWFGVLSF